MTIILIKNSAPGWQKEFADLPSAVIELRRHICRGCLSGSTEDDEPPLDHVKDGVKIECHDMMALLNTSCGWEFDLEGDHGLWPEDDNRQGVAQQLAASGPRLHASTGDPATT